MVFCVVLFLEDQICPGGVLGSDFQTPGSAWQGLMWRKVFTSGTLQKLTKVNALTVMASINSDGCAVTSTPGDKKRSAEMSETFSCNSKWFSEKNA